MDCHGCTHGAWYLVRYSSSAKKGGRVISMGRWERGITAAEVCDGGLRGGPSGAWRSWERVPSPVCPHRDSRFFPPSAPDDRTGMAGSGGLPAKTTAATTTTRPSDIGSLRAVAGAGGNQTIGSREPPVRPINPIAATGAASVAHHHLHPASSASQDARLALQSPGTERRAVAWRA